MGSATMQAVTAYPSIGSFGASQSQWIAQQDANVSVEPRTARFEATMEMTRVNTGPMTVPHAVPATQVQVAQLGTTPGTDSATRLPGAGGEVQASPESRDRALRGFGFDEVAKPNETGIGGNPVSTGDSILEGLKRLRGAFDTQATSLAQMNQSGSMSAGEMLALQVEVVKYGLLIDVTSKLTGKSTQAFDTLLKGQ